MEAEPSETNPAPAPDGGTAPGTESVLELFQALESPLLGYALRLLKNQTVAEDVVQEAFLRLHSRTETVREPRRWLYRTVHNLALNHMRDAQKIVPLPSGPAHAAEEPTASPEPADLRPLPDEALEQADAQRLLRDELARLDDQSRELLQLKFHQGLSYKQIGERTGLSPGNVGYLLHHAVKTLSAGLARSGLLS